MTGQIILNEAPETYFKRELDVASNSGLKIIGTKSLRHYKHWCDHPEDDATSAALDFGHALHCAVLEPGDFDARFSVLPADAPRRPTAAQWNAKKPSPDSLAAMDWWRQWNAANQGKQILAAETYDMVRGMGDNTRRHVITIPDSSGAAVKIRCGELFDMCQKEVTLRWTDERTGVRCKARADLVCNELGFGGDLKSTVDASPDGFARAVHRYLYHQQHVHYTDGAQASGEPWQNFLFFAIEKEKPYVPGVYFIPAMAEERGRFLRDRALDRLKGALETGNWSGYTDTITELILPAYAYFDAND